MNIYTIKMAGVFMITTSTIAICTGFAPRWLAMLGYSLFLLLLFGSYYLSWSFIVFPLWVLVMSIYIFFEDPRARSAVRWLSGVIGHNATDAADDKVIK
jgi:hypothetical protein